MTKLIPLTGYTLFHRVIKALGALCAIAWFLGVALWFGGIYQGVHISRAPESAGPLVFENIIEDDAEALSELTKHELARLAAAHVRSHYTQMSWLRWGLQAGWSTFPVRWWRKSPFTNSHNHTRILAFGDSTGRFVDRLLRRPTRQYVSELGSLIGDGKGTDIFSTLHFSHALVYYPRTRQEIDNVTGILIGGFGAVALSIAALHMLMWGNRTFRSLSLSSGLSHFGVPASKFMAFGMNRAQYIALISILFGAALLLPLLMLEWRGEVVLRDGYATVFIFYDAPDEQFTSLVRQWGLYTPYGLTGVLLGVILPFVLIGTACLLALRSWE